MKRMQQSGFTIIEVLVVLALLAIVATISTTTLRNLGESSAHKVAIGEVQTALIDARNDTLASKNDSVYGVHITATSSTRFSGSSYNPGEATNKVYQFEQGVTATSSLLQGGGVSIVFKRLTGEPTATGTIFMQNREMTATSSIVIEGSGLIEN